MLHHRWFTHNKFKVPNHEALVKEKLNKRPWNIDDTIDTVKRKFADYFHDHTFDIRNMKGQIVSDVVKLKNIPGYEKNPRRKIKRKGKVLEKCALLRLSVDIQTKEEEKE